MCEAKLETWPCISGEFKRTILSQGPCHRLIALRMGWIPEQQKS